MSDHSISLLKQYEESFVAGKVKYFLPKWQEITSDKTILNIIEHGLRINLTDIPNQGHFHTPQHAFSYHEKEVIDKEIAKLIAKKIVTQTSLEERDFISPIFAKSKKDGSYRMILNLKKLNALVDAPHFKMESIRNIVSMVRRNVWIASVDLKDAFFTIPICEDDINYLKFLWDGQTLAFLAMPDGYSDAMCIFTKILKPPFKVLREEGHLSVVYVDDVYLQGETRGECCQNILATLNLMLSLGFTIKCSESIFDRHKKLPHLVSSLIKKI